MKALGTKQGGSKMPDAGLFRDTLTRHDAELHALGNRVQNVEEGVKALSVTVTDGFKALQASITDIAAQKGPGWKEILGGIAAVGVAFSVLATSVTMIVQSSLGSTITKLETIVAKNDKQLEGLGEDDRAEFVKLRQARRDHVDTEFTRLNERLEKLQEKMGWVARVDQDRSLR